MKMNRFLALVLCLTLLLCGCGGSSEARDQFNGAVAETWAVTEDMKYEMTEAGGVTSSTSLSEYSDPNAKLIRTLDDVMKIQSEGRAKRLAAEAEMAKMENDLKNKLLQISGGV